MTMAEEYDWVLGYVNNLLGWSINDNDSNILRSLWTAYCLHNGVEVCSELYEIDLMEVWEVIEKCNCGNWDSYDDFDAFMCKYLL